jgi:sulfur carrier protein
MITLFLRKQTFQLVGPLSVKDALSALGLSPETHLVVRDGVLLEEDDQLQDGDVVRLVSAISGG